MTSTNLLFLDHYIRVDAKSWSRLLCRDCVILLYANKAQSQDEEALVNAASNLNMLLTSKDSSGIAEICFNGSKFCYEVLDVLEFTSDRKRMSIVVKEVKSGKFLLLSKGADEAIFPRSCPGQQTKTYLEAVEMYSHLGLRTLCLGCRDLEEDEYKEWSKKFQDASCSLDNREHKIAEVCNSLEQGIHILGITAIEDRLQIVVTWQDGVPETIKLLRKAGINVWMLTGDKQTTAIQIGLLCNLITPESKGQLLSINGKTEDDILQSLERALIIMKTASERKVILPPVPLSELYYFWHNESRIMEHFRQNYPRLVWWLAAGRATLAHLALSDNNLFQRFDIDAKSRSSLRTAIPWRDYVCALFVIIVIEQQEAKKLLRSCCSSTGSDEIVGAIGSDNNLYRKHNSCHKEHESVRSTMAACKEKEDDGTRVLEEITGGKRGAIGCEATAATVDRPRTRARVTVDAPACGAARRVAGGV
ncbi:hypothetical protein TRIUR3_08195 [Triticum urartu]|uniref:Uncharacterized protein n=1 Tax=Triticum urartu TaxID=4572 RepID=M7ZTF6_TRIUA|nr:hypothetical protein TRIUR3_08195 [Triticum urartu]